MTCIQRSKQGLRLIRESFGVLWQYKFLVTYPLLSMTTFGLLQFLIAAAYGIWTFNFLPDQKLVAQLLQSSHYFVVALLFFMQSLLVTFFAVALAHHIAGIVHRVRVSTLRELMANIPKITSIVAWTIILVIMNITQNAITIYYQQFDPLFPPPVALFFGLAVVTWIFLTSYVIPIIALETIGLAKAIKISIRLARKTWIEILTGIIALLILTSIVMVPAGIWFMNLSWGTILVTLLLVWPVQCIGSAISTIFITLAYHEFYKRPMEQVDMLRYPEF